MKTIIIIIFFSSVMLVNLSATAQIHESIINPYWDFYSLNYQPVENAGKGYTGAASEGNIMSGLLNPASVKFDKKYQAYLEYDVKNSLPWSQILSSDIKIIQVHPAFAAGFGFRLGKDFHAGVIIRNERNWMLDFGKSRSYPGMEYYDNYQTYTVNTLTVPVAWHYKAFDFGVNLNLMLLHSRQVHYIPEMPNPALDESTNNIKFVPDIGIRVTPVKDFSLGATFTPGFEQELEREYPTQTASYKSVAYFPWKLGAGAEARFLNDKLKISGEYRFEHTSVYDGSGSMLNYKFKDRHNVRFGAEFSPDEKLTLRGGLFTLLDMRPDVYPEIQEGSLSQYNVTAGFSYKLNDVKFSFACVNGLSKQVEVMRISFGAVYDF
ncbi:MAG TPA: hypothetical protein VN514_02415 [Ignavibacteria bacterium]|nr:hypothetical protein [Ignavibacteria bacterium]